MSRGCDQCNKDIPEGAGCYFNEDEGSYYCSDACLEASFNESHGKGKWRRDKTENEAGGYISVRENNRNRGKWIPLNTFWTTVPDDDEDDMDEMCDGCGDRQLPIIGYCEMNGCAYCDICWNEHVQECEKCRRREV